MPRLVIPPRLIQNRTETRFDGIINMKKILTFIIIIFGLFQLAQAADRFDEIKKELSKEGCWQFEFISIIESDIFDTVDSADGEAYIASDNRYRVSVGSDSFWSDGKLFYSYSVEADQLIIEKDGGGVENEISFIIKLDEFYRTYSIEKNKKYRLIRRDKIEGDMPDSLIIQIDSKDLLIESIEYFDINEELNRIIFHQQLYNTECIDSGFVPNLPDSVERVKL